MCYFSKLEHIAHYRAKNINTVKPSKQTSGNSLSLSLSLPLSLSLSLSLARTRTHAHTHTHTVLISHKRFKQAPAVSAC